MKFSRLGYIRFTDMSPPARVVWIEIAYWAKLCVCPNRRHPRGWCGLKFRVLVYNRHCTPSPPARVVWIEIFKLTVVSFKFTDVATREGGVD